MFPIAAQYGNSPATAALIHSIKKNAGFPIVPLDKHMPTIFVDGKKGRRHPVISAHEDSPAIF